MATNQPQNVSRELVDLGETMRQVQIQYMTMLLDRDGKYTMRQVRRVQQAATAAEVKFDLWIVQYRQEMKKYLQAFAEQKTDEQPGLYDVERDR